ncbi:zinc-binding dehydrogenase [Proteiniclasticum sp.]
MAEELAALTVSGKVDPMISKVLPFSALKEGLRELTTRHARGKILVRVTP